MNKTVQTLAYGILNALDNVEKNIDNCSAELWEKKIGGDYYWNQVYHVLVGTVTILHVDNANVKFPMAKNTGVLNGQEDPNEPHGKDVMKNFLKVTREHVNNYVKVTKDESLHEMVTVFGTMTMPKISVLQLAAAHAMYHVGACDAFLRDHGLKSAL